MPVLFDIIFLWELIYIIATDSLDEYARLNTSKMIKEFLAKKLCG